MQLLTIVAFFTCTLLVSHANPAIEREFHRVVNSNQCLKECMQPVQESQLELSIFKRSNYTDYLLKLDTICELITNARRCIDGCGIESNPFALISMNAICSEKSRQDAKLLEPCLIQVGAQVSRQCVQFCGDYEQLNDQIHTAASTMKPEDETATQQFNSQTNALCGVLKCSARCSADQLNKQCGRLTNGLMAGDLIRDMVERILSTHRMDLQVFGLLEAMKKSSQPQCNYLFTPEVLFNLRKDMISQQMIRKEMSSVAKVEAIPDDQQRTESQLQVRVLKKQLQVLNKQLEILDKQEHKMDSEMPRFMQSPPQQQQLASNDMF